MKINGKTYKMPELDFNAVCKLEDMGVSMTDMDSKALSTVRGFIALSINGDVETAGREVQDHIMNGGNLDEIMGEINKAVENSGFFHALAKNQEEKTGTGKSEASKK